MKTLLLLLLVITLPTLAKTPPGGKILIIASNMQHMGDAEQHEARNNLWEVAPPYHVFVSQGYEVEFASPRGGKVEFFMDPVGISSYAIKYQGFLDKAAVSKAPETLNAKDYAAVYIGGGYGPLFDVADNGPLLKVMAKVYENGGVIGGSGHGPGAFANIRLGNGDYLVKGKRVAGFPNSTEKTKSWAKQGTLLPFLVEDKLRENGAKIVNKENIADKHEVIVDQRVVSTMFLPSAALVAQEMLNLMQ